MMLQRYVIAFVFISVVLGSCSTTEQKNQKWYNDTKAIILAQSANKPDSVVAKINQDSSYKEEHYYSKGNLYLLKGYEKGVLSLESNYSANGEWRYTRLICPNGMSNFEGIMYHDMGYGISTWRYCNGKIEEIGVRYNNEEVGTWKYYNEDGTFKKQVDYFTKEKLDPMPAINSGQ